MKRVLVAGGAGFLGSNLCKRLLEENCSVVCVDNLYTGCLKNIEEFQQNPNFEFIEHDIINPLDIIVDEIYNLACPASPVHYQRSPIYTTKTSVFGIFNMLDLATKCNAKILYTSTSEVYGEPLEHPQTESYRGNVNPVGIRACYDEGKRCAEAICFDYYRELDTQIKVVRIFNTYGPRMDMDDGRVVSNFIVQALKGDDITIFGDGSQTRSFCYVDDLVDALYLMMNVSPDNFQGPVNIGNPGEFSMLELADKVISLTNSRSKIIHLPLPADDPTQRKPDISLAKSMFNWTPKINLMSGLKKTIAYFDNLI